MSDQSDAGFTLIELLLGIVLLSIMMGAITGGLFLSFRTSEASQQRLYATNARNLANETVVEDIQATSPDRSDAASQNPDKYASGTSIACPDPDPLFDLERANPNDPDTRILVTYHLVDGTRSCELQREVKTWDDAIGPSGDWDPSSSATRSIVKKVESATLTVDPATGVVSLRLTLPGDNTFVVSGSVRSEAVA